MVVIRCEINCLARGLEGNGSIKGSSRPKSSNTNHLSMIMEYNTINNMRCDHIGIQRGLTQIQLTARRPFLISDERPLALASSDLPLDKPKGSKSPGTMFYDG